MPELLPWTDLERALAASMPLVDDVRDLGRQLFDELEQHASNPQDVYAYDTATVWVREVNASLVTARMVLRALLAEKPHDH